MTLSDPDQSCVSFPEQNDAIDKTSRVNPLVVMCARNVAPTGDKEKEKGVLTEQIVDASADVCNDQS